MNKIPCIFPASREFGFRDGFARDCLLQRGVTQTSLAANTFCSARGDIVLGARPFRGTTTLITSRTWTISLICLGWLRRRQRRPAALPAPAPEADQRRALSESQIREQRLAH